jgi:hypothetical protein
MSTHDDDFRHGERIATLEERYEYLHRRLNHLDDCIDSVKGQILQHSDEVRKNTRTWDDRWSFGKGVFWTMSALFTILSGIGIVLLAAIFNRLKIGP